jgi:hypothetical protein
MLRDRERREQPGNEAAQIGEAIGWSTQHDDGDGEPRQILLKGKAAVNGDEGVELVFRSGQELTVLEKHPHDAFAIIRAVASSRKATICSRLTEGNPARKSSIVSPPSR